MSWRRSTAPSRVRTPLLPEGPCGRHMAGSGGRGRQGSTRQGRASEQQQCRVTVLVARHAGFSASGCERHGPVLPDIMLAYALWDALGVLSVAIVLQSIAALGSGSLNETACFRVITFFFGQCTAPLLAKRKKIVTGEEEAPPMPAGLEPVAGSGTAEEKAAEGQKVCGHAADPALTSSCAYRNRSRRLLPVCKRAVPRIQMSAPRAVMLRFQI